MVYVTMTDKFMSGWGCARGLINKLVFECEDYDEARIVAANAEGRSDQKHVNIRTGRRPWYSPDRYHVQIKTKDEYPTWYKAGSW
jgi:hypothetical protein